MTGACTDASHPSVGSATGELTRPGPWTIPASTLAAGSMQDVTLTEGGAWTGPSGCAGGMTPGALVLRDYLREHYPQISSVGGYSCREIVGLPGQMSVHGTGRALDVMIPTIGGDADNDAGDVIGNWLIENAEHIGIQRIIWDRWMWSAYPAGYVRSEAYDWPGTSPHADHLHVEISVRASTMSTPFFSGSMAPPTPAGCAVLGPTGGTVDQDGACFTPYGDARFWRSVGGAGIAGSYLWTNAWTSDTPSNWARWAVRVASSGEYEVEAHVVSDHAVFAQTRYGVDHGGTTDSVRIDQGAAGGWRALGRFYFDGTGSEGVSVFDNHDGPVASDQHVCVDAIRVSRVGGPPPAPDAGIGGTDAGPAPGEDAGSAGGPMGGDAGETPMPSSDGGVPTGDSGGASPPVPGGCSVSASAPTRIKLGWWLALVVVMAARRRRT